MVGPVFDTVTSGVLVLVAGQIIRTLALDPMQELRKAIGDIDFTLVYTARWWGGSFRAGQTYPERTQQALLEAEDNLRRCASRLAAAANVIVGYETLARTGWIPSRAAVDEARGLLISLANTILAPGDPDDKNIDKARAIRRLLLLPPSPPGMSI